MKQIRNYTNNLHQENNILLLKLNKKEIHPTTVEKLSRIAPTNSCYNTSVDRSTDNKFQIKLIG